MKMDNATRFRRNARRFGTAAVLGAILTVPATAGVTSIEVQPLPPDRGGTVVAWQGKSKTAVVALESGRMMTVHALRRVKPGTRVRVNGIKWGKPTSGIKWSRAPRGIKWGIKWARNGTYQSNLRPIGTAKRARVRGVVVKRYRNAVAIGTRGGVVVVRQAVWLPRTGKRTKSTMSRPAVGDLVTTNVTFVGPNARMYGDGVRVIPTAGPVPVPTGGSMDRVNETKRTVSIASVNDPAYVVRATMGVPGTVNMNRLRAGSEVSATATLNADGSLRVAQLAPNASFSAANDPSQQIVTAPAAPAASIGLIDEAMRRWNQARSSGQILDATLYEPGLTLLRSARVAASDGQWQSAATALDQFQGILETGYPTRLDARVVAAEVSLVSVIMLRLGA